ncbi:MAG: helix-turn-helix transcriptional regulator [Hyphomicrobiaceae bacterium]
MDLTRTRDPLHRHQPVSSESSNTVFDEAEYLSALGRCVRGIRQRRQLSRRELSELSGVSPRFIAQLEAGDGNISIIRLKRIADALETPLDAIVALRAPALDEADGRGGRIALIGLRGAGKSTLGRKIAERFGLRFVELNREIESNNGLGVSEIFALYGGARYRQLERECLDKVIAGDGPMVLAIAGGIVDQPETYRRLLSSFTVIWLRASPDEHMARVLAQGDRRPVAGHPAAMEHLRGMLRDREPAYALAHNQFDTSGQSVGQSAAELCKLIDALLPAKLAPRKQGDSSPD